MPPLAKQKPIYFINWDCVVQEYLADTSMIIKKDGRDWEYAWIL